MSFIQQVGNCGWRDLALIPRILLLCDGTITDLIEVLVMEPLDLIKLSTKPWCMSAQMPRCEWQRTERIVERKAVLRGRRTGNDYIYAESLLAIDRLPVLLVQELATSDIPLGRLLATHRVETRKELMHVSKERADQVHFRLWNRSSDLLKRTYRVVSGGQTLMMISEYFPFVHADEDMSVNGVAMLPAQRVS